VTFEIVDEYVKDHQRPSFNAWLSRTYDKFRILVKDNHESPRYVLAGWRNQVRPDKLKITDEYPPAHI